MDQVNQFPTEAEQIYSRILDIDPKKYDQTRNHLDGFVSQLSPYITHGFLTLPLLRNALYSMHRPQDCYRFIFEMCWREFFQRRFARFGERSLFEESESRKTGLEYLNLLPQQILEANTGIKALDSGLNQLFESGYIHNHSRMWLASYITHFCRTDWKIGADLFFYHLLDGDLASNSLSWQWVFGTFSDKAYYFNQENINKYSPAVFSQKGTFLDMSYEEIYDLLFVKKQQLFEVGKRDVFAPVSDFSEIENDLMSEDGLLELIANYDQVIYFHEWMLNPALLEEIETESLAVFIIDRKFWEKYPASAKRFRFMVDLAKNIHDVKIFLGDPVTLFKKAALARHINRGSLKIISQEYFSDFTKSNFTSLKVGRNINFEVLPYPWLVPDSPPVPNRFSSYFRNIERSLFGDKFARAINPWKNN